MAAAARAALESRTINGRLYEVSVVTSCKVCRGVVVLSLTDDERRVLLYEEMLSWFYELNTMQMQCVGKKDHAENSGWGYYWNLDYVLQKIYRDEYARDLLERGGRQFFGIDIADHRPQVHVLRTIGMTSTAYKKRTPSG